MMYLPLLILVSSQFLLVPLLRFADSNDVDRICIVPQPEVKLLLGHTACVSSMPSVMTIVR